MVFHFTRYNTEALAQYLDYSSTLFAVYLNTKCIPTGDHLRLSEVGDESWENRVLFVGTTVPEPKKYSTSW
ncbi:hypothetical protein Pfo_005279 [Paulownia fortunei]|nr:hypothetical protein Pfo_005279 [Paulownia fortunei]